MSSFFAWFRRKSTRPLRMQARVSSLEIDLLDLRADLEGIKAPIRKLQGKIYRGVALGDTVEAAPAASSEPENPGEPPMSRNKADLYARAALLRRN